VSRYRSDYIKPDPVIAAEKRLQALSDSPSAPSDVSTVVWPTRDEQRGPTPRALQGDDVQLAYYEDGYPKLPACLDRRPVQLARAA